MTSLEPETPHTGRTLIKIGAAGLVGVFVVIIYRGYKKWKNSAIGQLASSAFGAFSSFAAWALCNPWLFGGIVAFLMLIVAPLFGFTRDEIKRKAAALWTRMKDGGKLGDERIAELGNVREDAEVRAAFAEFSKDVATLPPKEREDFRKQVEDWIGNNKDNKEAIEFFHESVEEGREKFRPEHVVVRST